MTTLHPEPRRMALPAIPPGRGGTAFLVGQGFLGDDLCTTPLARYLKQQGYRVTLFTRRVWQPLFKPLDIIDEVCTRGFEQIHRSYADGDLVVLPFHHLHEFRRGYRVVSHRTIGRSRPAEAMPIVQRVLANVGLDPAEYDTHTALYHQPRECGVKPHAIPIVIGSSNSPARRLHDDLVREIYTRMRRRGLQPVIVCNVPDKAAFDSMETFVCRFAESADNLRQCVTLIERAPMIITPNSGLMHVRRHFNMPMLVLTDSESPGENGAGCWIELYDGMAELDASSAMADVDKPVAGHLAGAVMDKLFSLLDA